MLRQIISQLTAEDLLKGQFGVEREALRVNLDGTLALTKHPESFGEKMLNPYITTDFSESQVEMITPPQENLESTHKFLTALYHLVVSELQDERLWPQSMPCILEDNQEIPVAIFPQNEKGLKEMNYRKFLLKKYGGKRQLISGIHYNFSFSSTLMEKLYQHSGQKNDFKTFKDQIYLKVARNYLRYRWLLVYFLGASPVVDKSYCEECDDSFVSFRNSPYGYQNETDLQVRYDDIEAYVNSLKDSIEKGLISNHKEFYSPIRLKPSKPNDLFNSLLEEGINYLEIRSIDLNPFEKEGISLEDLKFIHLLTLFLLDNDEPLTDNWQLEGDRNECCVAKKGMHSDLELIRDGEMVGMRDWASEVLSQMAELNAMFNLQMDDIIANKKKQLMDFELTLSSRVTHQIKEEGYLQANLEWSNGHYQAAMKHPYAVPGFEDLELSTQILIAEAIKKGIQIEILDRLENFIQFKQGNQVQLVKQATKTALDTYITVLAMENKEVTKQILRTRGISVPAGLLFESPESAIASYDSFQGKAVVIKPKSTNFGQGITIFNASKEREEWKSAIKTAFSFDQSVIIEEFQTGNEFRFLIVDDELIGILQRVPANVVGDGVHTIKELVEIKNQDSLRGTGYKSPLEKIKIDDQVHYYLKMQGFRETSILPNGTQIFLRENSNISTGGDSLDMTDAIPDYFKQQALEAVRQIGARICGVDMIIEDISNPDSSFSIIELNFNPAIHIHAYPFQGKSRNAAPLILKALGF